MTPRRPGRRLLISAVVCVGAMFATALPAQATFDGDNGPITFRRYTNEDHTRGAIFLVRPDGTGGRQLTHPGSAGVDAEPDVSPNGRWVVYSLYRNAEEDQSVLKKIRINGTHRRTLDQTCTDPCLTDGYPAWGPGGKRIAFQRGLGPRTGGNRMFALFVMRADGSHARQITQRGKDPLVRQLIGDFAPPWSPNGRRLAFERFSQTRGHQAVFTVRLDGTGLRRITPWWLDASQPDYSPDGRWILFRTRENSDVSGNIQLVRPNGAHRHTVTHARSGHGKWLSASFSPNGRRITAGHTRVVDGQQLNADVFTFRLDGSGRRNVTATPNKWESAVDWGPTRR
jgi:TolB protein